MMYLFYQFCRSTLAHAECTWYMKKAQLRKKQGVMMRKAGV